MTDNETRIHTHGFIATNTERSHQFTTRHVCTLPPQVLAFSDIVTKRILHQVVEDSDSDEDGATTLHATSMVPTP